MSSRRVAVVAAALVVLCAGAFGATVAVADDGDGSSIGVTVVDETPSPTPSPTPSRSPSTSPGGGSGSGAGGGSGNSGGGSGTSLPTPSPTSTGSPDGPEGWIVVTGLDPSPHTEINPLGGWMHVVVSVANRSATTPVSGKMVFRLFTVFGTPIGPSVTQQVSRVPPGEIRTSSATLEGIGQWTFVRVTAEFIPAGATSESGSISRDTWVFVFPWLVAVIAVLSVAVAIIVRVRQRAAAA